MSEESKAPENTEAVEKVKVEKVEAEKLESSQDDRNIAMLCALLQIITGIIGPLIVWLLKKESSPLIDKVGKETINFQITMIIAWVIASLLTIIVIGLFLYPIIWIFALVCAILATLRARDGIVYRYPICIRFLK